MTRLTGLQPRMQLAGVWIAAGLMIFPSIGHCQASRTAVTATKAPSTLKMPRGTVMGYIFWDARRVAYSPSAACQGLQVGLSALTGTGVQSLGSTSQFQLLQSSRPGSSLYMCSYTFNGVPEGVALMVQLNLSASLAKQLGAKGPFPLGATATLVKVPGGECNNSTGTTLSATYLQSGWVGCGENTSNVNFELVPEGTMGVLPPKSTVILQPPTTVALSHSTLLQPNSQPGGPVQKSGTLLPAVSAQASVVPTGAQPIARSSSNLNGGSTKASGTSGQLVPAVRTAPQSGTAMPSGTLGQLLPAQPNQSGLLRGAQPGSTSTFTGGTKPNALPFQGTPKLVTGAKTKNALIPDSQFMMIARQKQAVNASGEHTLASGSASLASRMTTAPRNATALHAYDPLTPQERTDCRARELQKLSAVIYRIDGQPQGQGVVYTPDPSGNPYTIIGCGFGNKGIAGLNSYGQNGKYIPSQSLQIQSWNDNEVVASVDPDTSGIPDWPAVQFYVQSLSSNASATSNGSFYARRKTVPLASIPQGEASLYSQGSPFFLSPVSNYYGLTGTLSIMRQGMPANSLAGQDTFVLQLSPGFVVDSTQTSLLVSTTDSNVTIKAATVNGNTVTVIYPILSSGSGNSANYYSIYGLNVWVSGPVGISPTAP